MSFLPLITLVSRFGVNLGAISCVLFILLLELLPSIQLAFHYNLNVFGDSSHLLSVRGRETDCVLLVFWLNRHFLQNIFEVVAMVFE